MIVLFRFNWCTIFIAMLMYLGKQFAQTSSTLTDTCLRVNQSLLTNKSYWQNKAAILTPADLAKQMHDFNSYPQSPQKGLWTLYYLAVNDTFKVPYLVHIPRKYDATKKSPLYVYLHGAVSKPNFTQPTLVISPIEKLLKAAMQQNAFIIYPFAKQSFNWLFHQQAFEAILAQISEVKSLYNIDDNKVYLGGHSDGARGAFWFTLNNSSAFAACFGICYEPVLFNINTPLSNLYNIAFYGVSATADHLYSNRQINQMVTEGQQVSTNWYNYNVQGGHDLPYAHPDSLDVLYNNMKRKSRNPFVKSITWETDDIKNGRFGWIAINALDTMQKPKSWHYKYNFNITSLISGKKELINLNPSRSGIITATLKNNRLSIKTSCVSQITFYAWDGMLDINKPLIIRLNDNAPYSVMLKADSSLMVDEFLRTRDRTRVILAKLTIPVNHEIKIN